MISAKCGNSWNSCGSESEESYRLEREYDTSKNPCKHEEQSARSSPEASAPWSTVLP